MKTVLAFDFGASSGRAIRGVFDGGRIAYEEVHRFENIPLAAGGRMCHDVNRIMGGGTRDGFLCQLAADSLGLPVMAGPVEATALGNILLQLAALGEIKNVDEGREIAAREEKLAQYAPRHTPEWEEAYGCFIHIIHREV